jgi:hypothetical protein
MVEISRNQILETRDWTEESSEASGKTTGIHGGILIAIVTPPTLSDTTAKSLYSQAVYKPGLPALRVEENVVRVALGQALVVLGFGPFAISNNHFTCGGTVRGTGIAIAQTVLILNLGSAIDNSAILNAKALYEYSTVSESSYSANGVSTSSNGTVIFTNNICQLEARRDRQRSLSSLFIISTDHLTFSNNECWLDGIGNQDTPEVAIDAVLLGRSLLATSNRFEEAPLSVGISGWTIARRNITSQNIATYCLFVQGAGHIDSANLLVAVTEDICKRLLADSQ